MRVTCDTCGADASDDGPCWSCDANPAAWDWDSPFRFEQALHGMRQGKRMRRPGWDKTWSIEAGKLVVRWPDPAGGEDAVALACELHEDDILADDWEVAA